MSSASRHHSTAGPICPFCEHQERPDEPFYWDEATTEMTCGSCDRDYPVSIYVQTSWTTAERVEDL